MTRRQTFHFAAFSGLAFLPTWRTLDNLPALMESSFTCDADEERVIFSVDGKPRWIIDRRMFDGPSRLACQRSSNRFCVGLRDAKFPGTKIPADFECVIERKYLTWQMEYQSVLGGFKSHVPFVRWLMGLEAASGLVRFDHGVDSFAPDGRLQGRGSARMWADWRFEWEGETIGQVRLNGSLLPTDLFHLTLLDEHSPSLSTEPPSFRTLLLLKRGAHSWGIVPSFHSEAPGRLVCPDNYFSQLSLELWTDRNGVEKCVALAEARCDQRGVHFEPSSEWLRAKENVLLPLINVCYACVIERGKRKRVEMVLAHLGETPSWVKMEGWAFEIGGTNTAPEFEMTQRLGRLPTICCEPEIIRVHVPLQGAIAEPILLASGMRLCLSTSVHPAESSSPIPMIQFVQQGEKSLRKNPRSTFSKPRPGTQTPSGSSRVKPGSLLLSQFDYRVIFQTPKSSAVTVLRPEDLLVLKFEWKNLTLQPGPPPKLVRDVGPNDTQATLTVWFPPQHIAEEAFYQTPVLGMHQPYPKEGLIQNKESARNEPGGGEEPRYPIAAQIAGWSKLVFEIPKQVQAIPYTLQGLLDWSNFTLAVAPAALPASPPEHIKPIYNKKQQVPLLVPQRRLYPTLPSLPQPYWAELHDASHVFHRFSVRLRREKEGFALVPVQQPRQGKSRVEKGMKGMREQEKKLRPHQYLPSGPLPPLPSGLVNVTAIEAPYRLYLSPNTKSEWLHARDATATNGRYELWHTRLETLQRTQDGKPDDWYRTLRAIWSPDYRPNLTDEPNSPIPKHYNSLNQIKGLQDPSTKTNDQSNPFRMSLDAKDRHELVHLTGSGSLEVGGIDSLRRRAIHAEQFMMSALGAWMKLHFVASTNGKPEEITDLDLIEWRHQASMGRDYDVQVVSKGCLYCTEHAASLVKVTKRTFQPQDGIEGPTTALLRQRMFILVREPTRFYKRPDNPFSSLQILTLETPNLDDPNRSQVAGLGQDGFWPSVGNTHFQFHLKGMDRCGQSIEFSAPLLYVADSICNGQGTVAKEKLKKVREEYLAHSASRILLDSLSIAFAECSKEMEGRTSFETKMLQFDTNLTVSPKQHPQFVLKLRTASVTIPAIRELLGSTDPVGVTYHPHFVREGWGPNNQAEIFLGVLEKDPLTQKNIPIVQFAAEKAGGLANPDFKLSALSRTRGPVGGLGNASEQQGIDDISVPPLKDVTKIDPSTFFNGATILGGIPLERLLAPESLNLASEQAPQLMREMVDGEIRSSYKLKVQRSKMRDDTRDEGGLLSCKPGRDGKLVIKSSVTTRLSTPGTAPSAANPVFSSEGLFGPFTMNFAEVVEVKFKELRFRTEHGKKPDITAELEDKPVQFLGALSFFNALQELIPSNGLSDPPSLEVTPTYVRAGFSLSLPPVPLGVFSLENLKFSSALTIPFIEAPVTLRFAFSEKSDPFLVTVALFSGGGFFALELNAQKGIAGLEVALEFGGRFMLNIGVATGGVFVMARFYFKYEAEPKKPKTHCEVEGCLRMGGFVSVLELISVSVEFNMTLAYVGDVVKGYALLVVKVEIAFFSTSVDLYVEREFAGSAKTAALIDDTVRYVTYGKAHRTQNRPRPAPHALKIAEMMSEKDWSAYANAFATDQA